MIFLVQFGINKHSHSHDGDSNFWVKICLEFKSQRKTHQITLIRHFEPQEFCNEKTV